MAKRLFMGLILRFCCSPPPPGSWIATAVDLHGGTEGSGSPSGNHNAFRHGRYSAEAIACRRKVAALLRACRDQLGAMCEL